MSVHHISRHYCGEQSAPYHVFSLNRGRLRPVDLHRPHAVQRRFFNEVGLIRGRASVYFLSEIRKKSRQIHMSKKRKNVCAILIFLTVPYCSLLLHRTRTEKKGRDEFSAACQIRVRGRPGVPATSRCTRPRLAPSSRALVSRGPRLLLPRSVLEPSGDL